MKPNRLNTIKNSLPKTVLLILISSFWACQFTSTTAGDLFQENFHPFPNMLVDLENKTLDSTYEVRSFLAYRQKEYQLALDNFEKIPNLTKENPLQLYQGVCYLALGNSDTAREILLPISELKGEYKDAANWYLALAALKSNDINETQTRLQLLTNRSTYIRNEAQVLISKVNELE